MSPAACHGTSAEVLAIIHEPITVYRVPKTWRLQDLTTLYNIPCTPTRRA
ncbi:hypothetical protein CGLO_16678 [Colletotrichum gloeosporioides Cg-14]|uniref:Uncharacterized protein n=1 Tax=Colletotrichum gloeosporioides (strain Cg-14) TaxID=1237896 RepID=T0L8S0_COLGC|nr:hypothetical protein CGLO_16678 [Colletotrichum gloeosporioides Cg-14]